MTRGFLRRGIPSEHFISGWARVHSVHPDRAKYIAGLAVSRRVANLLLMSGLLTFLGFLVVGIIAPMSYVQSVAEIEKVERWSVGVWMFACAVVALLCGWLIDIVAYLIERLIFPSRSLLFGGTSSADAVRAFKTLYRLVPYLYEIDWQYSDEAVIHDRVQRAINSILTGLARRIKSCEKTMNDTSVGYDERTDIALLRRETRVEFNGLWCAAAEFDLVRPKQYYF